jgi:AraC family transcriptional regulator of arabinose operon
MRTGTHFLQTIQGRDIVVQKRLIMRELDNFKAAIELKASALPRDVQAILEYIHRHLFEPALKVIEARRQCGVKNNNIATYFRQMVGMGIREYIEHRRMQAAMQLLAHEELEIFLIGLGIGYSHEESFTRAFRRRFGRSPSEYRKEIVKKKC